jgi:SAM-dependent methyltransferase
MIKNLNKKVRKYYKSLDTKLNFTVANQTIFRLLANNNFNFKNKKILDIGFGKGGDLIEFQRRGGETFGIEIRKKILKSFVKKYKQNPKNYFVCDLNKNFPKINKKMDLVLSIGTLLYLNTERQFIVFNEINKILKKNGYFLFHYVQTQYIRPQLKLNSKNFFSCNLNNQSEFRKLKEWFNPKNPVPFLKNQHVKKLLKNKKFKLKSNIFDINTLIRNKKTFLTINRFILLQKI